MARSSTLVLLSLALQAACDDEVFPAIPYETAEEYAPTWDGVTTFFGDHCTGCHPMAQLVAADLEAGERRLVVPGDPGASRLWRLLSGLDTPTMPFGGPLLPEETIDHVRVWILDGAPREAVTPTTYTPDWEGVTTFFTEHCRVCHSGAPRKLPDIVERDLDEGIGQLVVPGDPDASRLWRLLTGEDTPRMPQGGALPLETIDHVRGWIAAGAER